MTPEEFIARHTAGGITRTAAVVLLARACGVGQRRVWDWLQGKPVPAYAQRLLHIWSDCTPAQRQKWYS